MSFVRGLFFLVLVVGVASLFFRASTIEVQTPVVLTIPAGPLGSASSTLSHVASTTESSPESTAKPKKTTPVVQAPTPPPQAPTTAKPAPATLPIADLNTAARAALVNILCVPVAGIGLSGESGSGFFIDSRGVILTNAHIAQYLLLSNYPSPGSVECTIRIGSPAQPRYHATLLYISPKWVEDNAQLLRQENPAGTGENDFALLLVSGTTNPNGALPTTFPTLTLADPAAEVQKGTPVLLASYPAEFFDATTIQQNLYAASTVSTVQDVFTFATAAHDVISLGGVILAEKGSSGGPVVDQRTGAAIGVLVTSTSAPTTGERNLFAITVSHIYHSFEAATGHSLSALLAGSDLQATAQSFQSNIAPHLTELLAAMLPK